jgi:hypothetical protein
VKRRALAVLAIPGCVTGADGPPRGYPVDAVAALAPLDDAAALVDGPIEVLGTGMPDDAPVPALRTVAAYHVRLASDVSPFIGMLSAASCRDRDLLTAPDDPVPVQDLGVLRRVGDETHFFAVSVPVGDRTVDIDTGTTTAFASRTARFPRIIVALDPYDLRVLACGELIWQ